MYWQDADKKMEDIQGLVIKQTMMNNEMWIG